MDSRLGRDLAQLLDLWRQRHGKRATGGWWSLAGFSYQAAVFLARFFRIIEDDGHEPGQLAEIESISDIVYPSDGLLRLIQVKRTLDARALRAFLEEAYLLTQLCCEEIPELIPHLRFQVGCRRRATPLAPADVPMSEVIAGGDEACWRKMIERIDPITPVLEERDPLDELHVAFWSAGIRDSAGLIERLLGRLLSAFLANEPDQMRSLGRDLWSLYVAAERHKEWGAIGGILTPAHVRRDPDAARNRKVLAGQTAKLEHLRKGFFRDRPAMLRAVRARFDAWLENVESGDVIGSVPVFWIAGRSGEGKSVLLLQLIADLLLGGTNPVLLHVTARGVQDLLSLASRWPPPAGTTRPLVVVVDDIYDLHDRDSWEQAIREYCTLATPPLCILTCGPTEQRELFSGRLAEVFDVTSFELPRLTMAELDEFVNWYELRSGRSPDTASLTRENPLLVQVIFELAQGVRMPEFARRFRRRLLHFGVFDAARTIVAATALYLEAPLAFVADSRTRDALERLCGEDQLHFRIDESPRGGVRLAHPHLAWLLFQEWVEPPETLEKALAREFHKILEARAADSLELAPFRPIHGLLETSHVGTASDSESIRLADRVAVIRELYTLHLAAHSGSIHARALPRWLELQAKVVGLALKPSPLSYAIRAMTDASIAPTLHGSVAGWVWLLAETIPDERERFQKEARTFFLERANNPGVAYALGRILAQSRETARASLLIREWLDANALQPQAYRLLASLVAAGSSDDDVRLRATQ